jgi:hypothetical protein
MSWSELERFVDDVEDDSALNHCRSRKELILAGAATRLPDHADRSAACVAGGAAGTGADGSGMSSGLHAESFGSTNQIH